MTPRGNKATDTEVEANDARERVAGEVVHLRSNADQLEGEGKAVGEDTPMPVPHLARRLGLIERDSMTRREVEETIATLRKRDWESEREWSKTIGAPMVMAVAYLLESFKPTDAQIAAVLMGDVTEYHNTRVILHSEEGQALVGARTSTKVLKTTPYAQKATLYKQLAKWQIGQYSAAEKSGLRTVRWDQQTGQRIDEPITGVLINGALYATPVEALMGGVGLRATHMAFKQHIRPDSFITTFLDLPGKKSLQSQAEAAAPTYSAVFRVLDAENNQERRKRVPIIEDKKALYGGIKGLISAARAEKEDGKKQPVELTWPQKRDLIKLMLVSEDADDVQRMAEFVDTLATEMSAAQLRGVETVEQSSDEQTAVEANAG